MNVTVPALSATSKPSPAAKVAVPPNAIGLVFEPSETVNVGSRPVQNVEVWRENAP